MLPTPDQLALFVDLLDGKKGALWRWISLLCDRKKVGTRSVWAVETSAVLLIFTTVLSSLIIAADTWLHVSTKPVPMPYFADVNPAEAGSAYCFSRELTKNCRESNEHTDQRNKEPPCSIYLSDTVPRVRHPEKINSMLLNSVGSSDTIYQENLTGLAFIGGPSRTSLSFSDRATAWATRFNASTFAMNTTCYLVPNCKPQPGSQIGGSSNLTDCGLNFDQNTSQAWFGLTPWSSTTDIADEEPLRAFASWAVSAPYPKFHVEPRYRRLIVDSELEPAEGSSVFLLRCNSYIYTIDYTWANDTLSSLLASARANQTLVNILQGPSLSGYVYNDDHLRSFGRRMGGIGIFAATYAKEDYTTRYASLISEIGLSFLGGSIEPSLALSLQIQNETVVTQVPKSALFVLISLNLWYAFIGLCLFLIACYVTAYGGRGAEVRAVRELLTVTGLATAAVQKTRSSQGDSLRIGVQKQGDEWQFKVWDRDRDVEGAEDTAMEDEIGRSFDLEASKGPLLVEVASLGSTFCNEGAEEDYCGPDDTPSWRARAVTVTGCSSISPVSTPDGSVSGDHEQRQLGSRSLNSARRSSQHSNDASDNTSHMSIGGDSHLARDD